MLRDLPRLLEQEPRFVVFVEGIVAEKFPRRDEFARLLDKLDESRQENRQKFEQIDKRFDEVDKRFVEVDKQFEELKDHMKGLQDWMQMNVGRLQTRAGRRLEDVVTSAFRFALNRNDIQAENVKVRQKICDTNGFIYPAGRTKEVDIIAAGDEWIVFEVKSTVEPEIVDDFADKLTLLQHLHPHQKMIGVLVSLAADQEISDLAKSYGITLLPPVKPE